MRDYAMRPYIKAAMVIALLFVIGTDTWGDMPELIVQLKAIDQLRREQYIGERARLVSSPFAADASKVLLSEEHPSIVLKAVSARCLYPERAERFDFRLEEYIRGEDTNAPVIIRKLYPREKDESKARHLKAGRLVRRAWLAEFDIEQGWETWSDRKITLDRVLSCVMHDPVGVHAGARAVVDYDLCVSAWRKDTGPITDLWFIEACMKHPELLDIERYLFMVGVFHAKLQKEDHPASDEPRLTNEDALTLAMNLAVSEELWARLAGMSALKSIDGTVPLDTILARLQSIDGKAPLDTILASLEDKCVAVRALALGSFKRYVEGDDESKVPESRRKISEAMTRHYAQEEIESFRQVMEIETRKLFGKQEAEATIEKMRKALIEAEKEKKESP